MAFRDILLRVVLAGLAVSQLAESQEEACGEFFLAPEDIVERAGETTLMSCQYDAEGTGIITWDKDMTFVTPGTSCDCQHEGNGLLRFNNLTAMDSGTYTCNANVENFPACSRTLRLAEAPDISDPQPAETVTGASGTTRTLSALVTGDPPPNTHWTHSDQMLSDGGRFAISSGPEGAGQRVTLTISDVAVGDRGVYKLHALNTAGQAQRQWGVPVIFVEVNAIQKTTTDGGVVELTCSGQFYTTGSETIGWERAGEVVSDVRASFDRSKGYEFSFSSKLSVDMASCTGMEEDVECSLELVTEDIEAQSRSTVCFDDCSPPFVSVEVHNCTGLRVELTGSRGMYTVEYKVEGTEGWFEEDVTLETSPQQYTIPDLLEATRYDVRVECPTTETSSLISTITTSSTPPVVVNVKTEVIYNSSGTFSLLQWQDSSSPDVTGYRIKWESDKIPQPTISLSSLSARRDWAIECNVSYTYQVAAVNQCGQGPYSHTVEQLCRTMPEAERVTLEELSPTSSATGAALLLSFTITQLHLVKSVRVDIEEQDSNFVALQTHNYSLSEAAYREGEACVSALSEGAHYLVCLRVNYSDIGQDSSCSRVGPVERGTVVTDKCFLPTSSRRVTDSGGSTGTSIPDWGIAVIVVGALLLVALIFCFLGLCFACQTSQSKNVDFGSSSSVNTERGGNVVPTAMHMHNPRTMSPTRSCLKYNRERGHSWNDHVDTLRQMETDKGTHV